MSGLGTIVNVAAIVAGSAAGLFLKKYLTRRITDTVMQGVGLAVVIIGLSGALGAAFSVDGGTITSNHILLMIVSLAIGGLIGELLRLDKGLDAFGKYCQNKLAKPGDASTFAQGLVTATLVFCVGSMAIVGALEDGINQNGGILFAKSALDGITSMILSSAMGVGVMLSAAVVGAYQGLITLFSVFAANFLSDVTIAQMSLVGSVLIMAIGLNILHIAKIKVENLLPAVLVPLLYGILMLGR